MNCLASRSAAVLLFLLSIAGVSGAFFQANSGVAKAASPNTGLASKAAGAHAGDSTTTRPARSVKQCCSANAALPASTTAPKPPAAAFINCHALETHTNVQPAVTIVVFNQKNRDDHVRLSDLLKDQPGPVEIKTSDGKWHKATVARLKSCFGRGLLFLSGDIDEPKDKEDFLLRFPPKAAS